MARMSEIGFAAPALLAALALSMALPAQAARKEPKLVAVIAAPSVRSGVEMWRNGDYAGAVAAWQPFASGGDMDAMFNMGQAYKLGRAVPRDAAIARDYYRRAAAKGHLPAQANLGILLFQAGEKPEAVRWLKAAADKNEMRAQYVLGVALWNGDGVPRSLTLAYGYLTRASAQGLAEATTALNSLTRTITPVERANGWAVATSLAAGNGIPPEFAGAALRSPLSANDAFNRDQVIRPLSRPLVVEPPRPGIAAAPAIVRTVPNSPVSLPPPLIAKLPPASRPVATANAAPQIVKTPPAMVIPAVRAASSSPTAAPTTGDRPGAPVVTTVAIPASASPLPAQPPVSTPEQVASAAPAAPKPAEKLVKPAAPKPMEWRVQLGAFSKKAQAEAAWTEVKTMGKQLVADRKPIYKADGNVTKLQLGPYARKTDARDACAKIAFSGRACFVTEG